MRGAEQVLALPSLRDPAQASYHNHTARELALAVFALAAVEGHPSVEDRSAPLRAHAWRALDNILEQTELVNPDGGYHESTDYMRITWAPLAMMAEVRRTATGQDPASRWSVFRNMGTTYLYKVLPDGTCAKDDDNEYPHLDTRDTVFSPTRGVFLELSGSYSDTWFGGEDQYGRLGATALAYMPLASRIDVGVRYEGRFSLGPVPFWARPVVTLRGAPVTKYQNSRTRSSWR